jgi:hypothetical protein
MRLLLDEGISWKVAESLRLVGHDVVAIANHGAPSRGSSDDQNARWCAANGDAVLVTNDQGRKNKLIFKAVQRHDIDLVIIDAGLSTADQLRTVDAVLRQLRDKQRQKKCRRFRLRLRQPHNFQWTCL